MAAIAILLKNRPDLVGETRRGRLLGGPSRDERDQKAQNYGDREPYGSWA